MYICYTCVSSSDVEEIVAKVKQMDIVLQAEAQALSLEALSKVGKDADRLFAASLNLLNSAFAASPEMLQKTVYSSQPLVTASQLMLLWGDHLHDRAKVIKLVSTRTSNVMEWDPDTLACAGQFYIRSYLRQHTSKQWIRNEVSNISGLDAALLARSTGQFTYFSCLDFLKYSECVKNSTVIAGINICSSLLVELNLAYCVEVTDVGFTAIADNCANLKKINLYTLKITDSAVGRIITSCKKLIHVDLCLCDRLSNKTLRTLSNHPAIAIVDVAGCENMSFDGIKLLVNKLGTQLKRISMGGVRNVTDMSYTELKIMNSNCESSVLPQRSVPLDLRVQRIENGLSVSGTVTGITLNDSATPTTTPGRRNTPLYYP
jgi:hypothetical protein